MSHMQATDKSGSVQITFPAITFDDGFVTQISGSITCASRLGLKKASHKKEIVVDANGNKFRILEVRKKRILLGWRFGELLGFMAGNPRVEVELIFSSPSKISLEETKELLRKSFKRQVEYWSEMIDFDVFRAKVAASDSFDQLFAVLREFHVIT